MNEKRLLKKLKKGDIQAFEYLFEQYYDWLCNYIWGLSGDRNLSKDIVQEVMIRFWEKRKNITVTGSLKSYLFKSCHNQFLQKLRKDKKEPDLLDKIRWDTIYNTHVEQTEDTFDEQEAFSKLEKLIDQLPPRCREIFIKSKLERRKYKEIAKDMEISIKTVENQMSKALQFLRHHATHLFF